MEFEVKNLIEARRLFNELSDKLYAIAEGDLDNSKYFEIYQNYEDLVCSLFVADGAYEESTDEWFSYLILQASEDESIFIEEKASGLTYYISTAKEIADLLNSGVAFECIEE